MDKCEICKVDKGDHMTGCPNDKNGDLSGTLNSLVSPKIVQILIAPNDNLWQGRLIGLGSDGGTYEVGSSGKWEPIIAPLTEG